MPISEVYSIKDGYAVSIERRNGTKYRVTSQDYQSLVDYRRDFLAAQALKRKDR